MSLIQRVRERLIRIGADGFDEQAQRDDDYLIAVGAFQQEARQIVASAAAAPELRERFDPTIIQRVTGFDREATP